MSRKPAVTYAFFSAVADAAYQHLKPDHPCAQFFMKAQKSGTEKDMNVAMDAVRLLPIAQRDRILCAAKRKLKQEAHILEWIMVKVGSPTDIPPGATRH